MTFAVFFFYAADVRFSLSDRRGLVIVNCKISLSSLLMFDFPVLRPVGHRHLPAVHLTVFEVVSRQDNR